MFKLAIFVIILNMMLIFGLFLYGLFQGFSLAPLLFIGVIMDLLAVGWFLLWIGDSD